MAHTAHSRVWRWGVGLCAPLWRPLQVPPGGGKTIYSCNEGNFTLWDAPLQAAVRSLKGEGPAGSRGA